MRPGVIPGLTRFRTCAEVSDSRLVGGDYFPGAGAPLPNGRTVVERLFKGDWRTAAIVAAPTVLVAYVLGLVASSYLIWTRSSLGDGSFGVGGHTNAGFFRTAFSLTGMAFGSPTFNSLRGGGGDISSGSTQAGMAPLTITLLTLAAFVYLLRRYDVVDNYRDRVETAIRAAIITALGLALLTIGMWGTVHGIHQTGSPGRVFFWSLLGFALVAGLASMRTSEFGDKQWEIWARWRLPIQAAVVAVTTAIVLGGIAGILIITAQADGHRADVLKALPILLAYFVNLGIDVLHIGLGASLRVSAGFGGVSVSLFNRHGLSAEYLLLFLLPLIAIAAGVRWIRGHRADYSPQDVARACYRMALPATLLCLVIAIPSRAGFSVSGDGSFGASGHAGVELFVGTMIAFGWFLVLGFLIGQWFLPRDVAGGGTAGRPPRLPTWLRGSVAAGPLAIVVGLIGVVVAAGGVASAKSGVHPADLGPVSNLTMADQLNAESDTFAEEGGGASVTVTPATPVPVATPDSQTTDTLNAYASAENSYFVANQVYTTDPTELNSSLSPPASLLIVSPDGVSFCIQMNDPTGQPWHYDSAAPGITLGVC